MKFEITVKFSYDVDMDRAEELYGTTVPEEMLAIDLNGLSSDPTSIEFYLEDLEITGQILD